MEEQVGSSNEEMEGGGVKSDTPNGRDEVCWSVQLMRRLLEVNGLGPAGSKRHWDTREDRC